MIHSVKAKMFKNINRFQILFYTVLLSAIGLALYFYSRVLGYLITSLVLAYVLDPIVNTFERLRMPRWLAVLSVYLVIGGILAVLLVSFAPDLVNQGRQLIDLMQSNSMKEGNPLVALPIIKDIHKLLFDFDSSVPNLQLSREFEHLLNLLVRNLVSLPQTIMQNFSTIIGAVSYLGMIPLICFFLLLDKVRFRKAIVSLFPNRYFELMIIMIVKIDETVGRFMRAMFFEVIAVAVMSMIALTILQVPYAVLISVVAGIANIIPYFGPFLGAGVAVLSSLMAGTSAMMIVWVIIAMYLVQVIDNNLVYPILVGKTINMHPLIVLLTVLAGGWFGGLLWILLSVPLLFVTYTMIREMYLNFKMFKLL